MRLVHSSRFGSIISILGEEAALFILPKMIAETAPSFDVIPLCGTFARSPATLRALSFVCREWHTVVEDDDDLRDRLNESEQRWPQQRSVGWEQYIQHLVFCQRNFWSLADVSLSAATWSSLVANIAVASRGFSFTRCRWLDDNHLHALLCHAAPSLRVIRLAACNVTSRSVVGFAVFPQLEFLECTDLRRPGGTLDDNEVGIDDDGFEYLHRLTRLRHLNLNDSVRISDASLRLVKKLKRLQILCLARPSYFSRPKETTGFSPAGIAQLASLSVIEKLDLSGQCITDAAAEHLGKLVWLKHLTLKECPITDISLRIIESLPRLEYVNLAGCRYLEKKSVLDLQKRLPRLRLISPY